VQHAGHPRTNNVPVDEETEVEAGLTITGRKGVVPPHERLPIRAIARSPKK